MSLSFHLGDIKDHRKLCWVPNPDGDEGFFMSPITHNLIHTTINIDMGAITEANYEEFYFRTNIFERLLDIPIDVRTTLQDIINHIGLSTNVVTKTRTQWIKRTMDYEWKELSYAAKRAKADSN